MATPADQRLLELLEKWLKSLELHIKYSSLDDDSYWKVQPWTEHQRPSRWILDLAKQKTIALRQQVEERVKTHDAEFSDSLELMIFLANLVGSEHIERFIPVAEAQNERALGLEPPDDATRTPASAITATREMPKFLVTKRHVPPPAGTTQVARTERKTAPAAPTAQTAQTAKPAGKTAGKQPVKLAVGAKPASQAKPPAKAVPDAAREQVIADAARLVQWGRKWFELPELIARMADRPALPEVRRILKENKSAIDEKA